MQGVIRVPIFLVSLIAITSAVAAEKIDLTKYKI